MRSKILVIDDEKPLREEIADWLQFEGYEVITAGNGRIGLATAIQEAPDLIVCDIAMPEMDGRAVLLEIRSDPVLSDIPFIFLTASATYESIRRGMNWGADDYLTKPFRQVDLLHAIESRLRKQAERQQAIHLQLEALEKVFQDEHKQRLLKSQLVAMFVHDFRNPLFAILSSAELMERQSKRATVDHNQQHLQRIGKAARLLLQMLNNMLAIAEIENGHLQYHPTRMDLMPFFEEILEEFRIISAESHRFVFESSLKTMVHADEKLLRQIITNLISNAVKYSPTGSAVTVSLHASDQEFTVKVTDEGIGIPEKDLARLFDAFYRMESTKMQRGTGLGLTIVQELSVLCGASIHVSSVVGVGSIFTVTFPQVACRLPPSAT